MAKRPTMLHNALLLTGSELLLRAISMLFQVYLAGRIGAAGIGLLQLDLTACALAATLALSGVKVASMYLTARASGRGDPAGVCSAVRCCLRYALCVSVCAGALLYALSGTVARRFVQDAAAEAGLRAYAVLLPGGCLAAVMHGYCTACGKVRRLVSVELGERLLSIALTVALLARAEGDVGRSLFAVLAGGAVAPFFSFALLYRRYRQDHRCVARSSLRPMRRELRRIALPLALGDYLRSGLNTVEQFLIPYGLAKSSSRYLGLAAYGTVSGMVFPILMFPSAILHAVGDLLVPELSRCAVRRQLPRIRSVTERCLHLGFLFSAAVAGFLFCAAEPLGQLFYHSRDAGYYLRLLSPMVLFLYPDVLVDGMQKGLGQQVYTVRYNTFTNVLDVIGLYTLLPRFGVGGYVFTYAATHLVNFFLSLRRLLRVSGCMPSLSALGRLLCLALVSGAFACLLPAQALFPALFLRGGAYLLLFLAGARVLTPPVSLRLRSA